MGWDGRKKSAKRRTNKKYGGKKNKIIRQRVRWAQICVMEETKKVDGGMVGQWDGGKEGRVGRTGKEREGKKRARVV